MKSLHISGFPLMSHPSAIEADTTRFVGVIWFAFYAEKMFKFRLMSEHGFTECFVIRDANFNAASTLLDKGE